MVERRLAAILAPGVVGCSRLVPADELRRYAEGMIKAGLPE
jgi:hypothetical protein